MQNRLLEDFCHSGVSFIRTNRLVEPFNHTLVTLQYLKKRPAVKQQYPCYPKLRIRDSGFFQQGFQICCAELRIG